MKKLTHTDLLPEAKKLHAQGYKKLHATHDGQFFTELEMARIHSKTIDSEVFNFSSEDMANIREVDPAPDPEPVITPEPEQVKKIVKPKKK